ncbi:MAG: class A beta-lactamase-related serine hydrolase [Chloroflexota bacterium]|nr:class A beta-lactamase-related serine hydrolase [Chloroflexota bacterium]
MMRGSALGLAVILALAGLIPGAPAAASTVDLVQHLDQLVSAFPGGAGIWIADPNTSKPLYSHDADEPIITASLYKLAVMTEAERRVDAGQLHYADIITIENEDITEDGSFEVAGTELTLDEALEAMITISDNGAALALWHVLGPENINATLRSYGIADFHVFLDWNEDNIATPRAVGTLLTLLAKRQLVSAAASDRMLARLERQQINDRLPAGLPEGVVIAHKTGNLPGLTHDAGIIFTPAGPRVVVAMTWDAYDADAYAFIANVASIVYSTLLEPPANARYDVPRTVLSADTGSAPRITIPITNAGSETWNASGAGSFRLIWEMRDSKEALVAKSPTPIVLPALAPGRSADVGVVLAVPPAPGDYKVTVGLVDVNGSGLAKLGAATASFQVRAHQAYIVSAAAAVPTMLHRGEASLLVTKYTALPTAGTTDHALVLSWRLIDTKTSRSVAQGTVPLGTLQPGATGTFFAPLIAPAVTGTFRLAYDVREKNVAVSETFTTNVTIVGARTFPDDEGGRTPPVNVPRATPAPTPRVRFPSPSTGIVPSPQLPVLPRGRPTPTANP